MKLVNIVQGEASVEVAGTIYGRVVQQYGGKSPLSWIAYDKEGRPIDDDTYGWPTRKMAANSILRHYIQLGALSA